jgi:hypothetical protein
MAYSLEEVPDNVRDILAHMPREMQQRVLADYETHYAPFLAMLAGWKTAVETHYSLGEDSAIARLQEQFFPLGSWKFPAQGLAVPQRPPEHTTDIAFGAPLADPALRPWMTAGEGWLQPTLLRDATLYTLNADYVFVLEADYSGAAPLDSILQRGQLAFVAGEEAFVNALQAGTWWVQIPGQPVRAASMARYDGYMAFEREMQTARANQRHLDLWLPPFYPYARKIIHLGLAPSGGKSGDAPVLDWLPPLRTGFRFVAFLSRPDRRSLAALRGVENQPGRGSQPLARLNPVPVVQTAVDDSTFYPPFPRAGSEYAVRMTGTQDIYAAVCYNDNVAVPASMYRLPSNDPLSPYPDVQVQFAPTQINVARIKIYHGSFGQERADNSDTPSALQLTAQRFESPYRIVGGVTADSPATHADWAREAWYHSVLRPPLLTEGDLVEIFRRRKGTFSDLVRFRYATREIMQDPEEGQMHWCNYLWPTLIGREGNFDSRYGEIPAAGYIPLIQSLRLAFERGPGSPGVPDFLLQDAANYLASVLSQYFVLSCFRVEGRLV